MGNECDRALTMDFRYQLVHREHAANLIGSWGDAERQGVPPVTNYQLITKKEPTTVIIYTSYFIIDGGVHTV